jgi:hypothetical protein
MKASSLAWITGSLITACALGGACTYNTYVIEPSGSSTGSGGGSTSSASSSGSTGSGGSGGSTSSSSSGGGGASSSSSGGGGGCTTDADNDGFIAQACGGNDCADNDGAAHPMQMGWFTDPIKGTMSFDFDCNKSTAFEYTDVLTCTSAFDCDVKTVKWVSAVPMCGAMGAYGVCATDAVLGCKKVTQGTRPQGCH